MSAETAPAGATFYFRLPTGGSVAEQELAA